MRLDHKKFFREGRGRGSPRPPTSIEIEIYHTSSKRIVRCLRQLKTSFTVFGGYSAGVTPVPIPNTEVKPCRADDTARVTVWESRSPPKFIRKEARLPRRRASLLRIIRSFEKSKKVLDRLRQIGYKRRLSLKGASGKSGRVSRLRESEKSLIKNLDSQGGFR